MAGRVKNYSSKTLWVVETDSGKAIAHRLAPNRQSPAGVDADGFKAVDGTPIDGHTSWIKVTDLSTADVEFKNGELDAGCWWPFCRKVEDDEFGVVAYDYGQGWGEQLP
jgi:hypothetical protein